MKYILILILGLLTGSAFGQKIISANPFTTAGGDLRGTYPNPKVGLNKIGTVNITTSLRDSIQRFRKDTTIQVVNATLNLAAQANLYGKFNRVYVFANTHTANTATVVLPNGADTLRNTEFVVRHLSDDTTSSSCTIFAFDGFAAGYTNTGYYTETSIGLKSRRALFAKPFYTAGQWYYEQSVVNYSFSAIAAEDVGITALTGHVTGSGSGSVATTIQPNVITSAMLVNGTIVKADIASQSLDSTVLTNRGLTPIKLSVTGATNGQVLKYNSGTNTVGWATDVSIYTSDGSLPSNTYRTMSLANGSLMGFNNATADIGHQVYALDPTGTMVHDYLNHLTYNASTNPTGYAKTSQLSQWYGGGRARSIDYRSGVSTSTNEFYMSSTVGFASAPVKQATISVLSDSYSNSMSGFYAKLDSLGAGAGHDNFAGFVKTNRNLGSTDKGQARDRTNIPMYIISSDRSGSTLDGFKWLQIKVTGDTTSNSIRLYEKFDLPNATPGTGLNYLAYTNNVPSFKEVKRDTTIYMTDVDYNFASTVSSTDILSRYNNITIVSKLTAGATSDNQLLLHTPSANFLQCTIRYYSIDASADVDASTIDFTTNGGMAGDGTFLTAYTLVGGQNVTLKVALDGGVYKWMFY